MKITKSTILTVIGILIAKIVISQPFEDKGKEITKLAIEANQGFISSKVTIKSISTDNQGHKKESLMTQKVIEVSENGSKILIHFSAPKDLKGTATLIFSYKNKVDDQWLYLAATKRIKRIPTSNISSPFMGSEFAYEDFSVNELKKYSYKFLKKYKLNEDEIFMVELYPVDSHSGYMKKVVHFNANYNYRTEKIEFYDRKEDPLKTLTYHNYKRYLDKYWRADTLSMKNSQTGNKTLLIFEDYVFSIWL